ncbi:MAG: BON domain-containing protein [Pirellulales bacterium]|nr:BON domain-containing protein [Pirellulales bacterium]
MQLVNLLPITGRQSPRPFPADLREPAHGNTWFSRASFALGTWHNGCTDSGGVVTLRGRVHSWHDKQLGLNSAQRVAGVLRLVDAIEVAPPRDLPARPARFNFAPELA